MEFSSLGGWVATRASGMKKNIYGNIEDMVSFPLFSGLMPTLGGVMTLALMHSHFDFTENICQNWKFWKCLISDRTCANLPFCFFLNRLSMWRWWPREGWLKRAVRAHACLQDRTFTTSSWVQKVCCSSCVIFGEPEHLVVYLLFKGLCSFAQDLRIKQQHQAGSHTLFFF